MTENLYNRHNPFYSLIKERYSLSDPSYPKETHHLVLCLKGSGITYQVGDSIGIIPENDPEIVLQTIQAMKAKGDEPILDRQQKSWTLYDFLIKKANITEINKKLFQEICNRQINPQQKSALEPLLLDENREALKSYLEEHHLWDFLLKHLDIAFTPQELCSLLMPLLPRFYSIASSQKCVGDEVHLTVANVNYESNGERRNGVCTHYICHRNPLNIANIPIYIQPHHGFTLPEDPQTPIIMIGPGTGVAPFRAFMQERQLYQSEGKSWLFFGEKHRNSHFFYESFWHDLIKRNQLRLDVAFSRDQEHKVYVQHRLLENGRELFKWLEEGASLYVCGDAKKMAKDVESALLTIFQNYGSKSEQEAQEYLKQLRLAKRYLRDVY